MGTRAFIGIENKDGSVDSIYTHWDGYISHHGPILLKNYNEEKKIRELLELRDLSILGSKIGEKHDFHNRSNNKIAEKENWCLSYSRDRGESKGLRRKYKNIDNFVSNCKGTANYLYLWREKKWFFCDLGEECLIWIILTIENCKKK